MIALQFFVLTSSMTYGYIATMKQTRQLKAHNVNFRMSNAELVLLDRLALQEDRSRSQVLRRLVLDGLRRHDRVALMANGE